MLGAGPQPTALTTTERYFISWLCRVLTIFPDVLFDRFFWLTQLSSEGHLDSKDTASCFCLPYSHTPIPYWLVNIYDIKFEMPWQFISIYWPSLDLDLWDSHDRNLVTSKKVLLERTFFFFFGLANILEIMSVYIENFTFFFFRGHSSEFHDSNNVLYWMVIIYTALYCIILLDIIF